MRRARRGLAERPERESQRVPELALAGGIVSGRHDGSHVGRAFFLRFRVTLKICHVHDTLVLTLVGLHHI
jgi:hypothetical protein